MNSTRKGRQAVAISHHAVERAHERVEGWGQLQSHEVRRLLRELCLGGVTIRGHRNAKQLLVLINHVQYVLGAHLTRSGVTLIKTIIPYAEWCAERPA